MWYQSRRTSHWEIDVATSRWESSRQESIESMLASVQTLRTQIREWRREDDAWYTQFRSDLLVRKVEEKIVEEKADLVPFHEEVDAALVPSQVLEKDDLVQSCVEEKDVDEKVDLASIGDESGVLVSTVDECNDLASTVDESVDLVSTMDESTALASTIAESAPLASIVPHNGNIFPKFFLCEHINEFAARWGCCNASVCDGMQGGLKKIFWSSNGSKSISTTKALPFLFKKFSMKLADDDDGMRIVEGRDYSLVIMYDARADLCHLFQFLAAKQVDAPQVGMSIDSPDIRKPHWIAQVLGKEVSFRTLSDAGKGSVFYNFKESSLCPVFLVFGVCAPMQPYLWVNYLTDNGVLACVHWDPGGVTVLINSGRRMTFLFRLSYSGKTILLTETYWLLFGAAVGIGNLFACSWLFLLNAHANQLIEMAVKWKTRLGLGMRTEMHITRMYIDGKVLVGVKFLHKWRFSLRLRLCFVEPAYFQMMVKLIFTHGINVTKLPRMAGWLDKLAAVIEQSPVEHNMLVVDVKTFANFPSDQWLSRNDKRPIAFVRVEVLEAVNMKSCDLNSFADPYVKCQIGQLRLRKIIHKKTLFPKWHEEFKILICTWGYPHEMFLAVHDKDHLYDDTIGDCYISVSELGDQNTGKMNLVISLEYSVLPNVINASSLSWLFEGGKDDIASVADSTFIVTHSDISQLKEQKLDKSSKYGSYNYIDIMDDFPERERFVNLYFESNGAVPLAAEYGFE